MAIPEPAGPLWDAVKAVYDPWPADDEAVAAELSGAWRSGGTVLAQGAQEAARAGEVSLAAWPDAAGAQFHGRVGRFAADMGMLEQSVAGRAAHADYYGAELASAKNAIVDTIARNEAGFAEFDNPQLGAAAPAMRAAFVAEIATCLQAMIGEKAAALRAYPADGPLPAAAYQAVAGNGGDVDAQVAELEQFLRNANLLTGPPVSGLYRQWLENAVRRGVPFDTIAQIARDHGITPEDFAVLNGSLEIREDKDGDGIYKSFFLLPTDISGEAAAEAVRLTYVLNAGTDYARLGEEADFAPTPYGSEELRRITERQAANSWTYDTDVGYVHDNHGRLVTTPNGILLGLGGNHKVDAASVQGGVTWGDTFLLNIDNTDDPAQTLRAVVMTGNAWYENDNGVYEGRLDLDRLLHHEEIHSQQWQNEGYFGLIDGYLTEELIPGVNPYEEAAGLSDGGY